MTDEQEEHLMPTGMELPIALPLGGVQPRRLLDLIGRIPDVGEGDRWLQGVTWEPRLCRSLTVDDDTYCSAEDMPAGLTPAECSALLTQAPFRISDAMKETVLDPAWADAPAKLAQRYSLQLSAVFASELLSGAGSGGHSLSSTATDPTGIAFGSAATPIWNALAVIEEEIAYRLDGGIGYIHLPPGMLAQAATSYGLQINENNMWETPAGNLVISDAGYVNPPPPTGEAASSAGTDWIYASGPVFFESTAPMAIGLVSETFAGSESRTPGQAFNRNTIVQYLAGYGILVFDPCPVTAVLVTYDVDQA